MTIRVGIIGYGKIAEDQHVPSMREVGGYEWVAASSRSPRELEVPTFTDHAEMLRAVEMDAVSICTPPGVRYELARDCIAAGKHVMLEKPPGVTLGEVEALAKLAEEKGVTLMTTWHSQMNPAVTAARDALAGERIASLRIVWHEDVRKWHPGQAWIFEPGGFGVFDPGINALSITTRIVPGALIVREAVLSVPSNKAMPIAAELKFASPAADGEMSASFDFRYTQGERWTIDIETASGRKIALSEGGAALSIDGAVQHARDRAEYPALYAEFAELIGSGRSHVDTEPLRVVADAFMLGTRTQVEAFED